MAIGRKWTTEIFARSDDDNNEQVQVNLSHLNESDKQEFSLWNTIHIEGIGDLFEVVKSQCSLQSLPALSYLSLSYFRVFYREADLFLKQVKSLSAETCTSGVTYLLTGI